MNDVSSFVLFSIGRTPVTLGSLAAALLIAFGGFVLARLLGQLVARMRGRARDGGASLYIVEKLVSYGLIVAALVTAVNVLGVNLTSLAVFAGALGVGVGLGLQGIVKEFVSGLVVITEGSLQVGDYIELEGGGRGEIKEIGPRATRIRNNDNVDILLPNSKLVEDRVTTWTHRGATRRIHIPFQVAYGIDKATVREAVLEAARSVPFTLPESEQHKSQVWLVGFAESGLNFELLVWPELTAVKRPAAMAAAYNWAIEEALCKYGIEMPLPQRELRVRSVFGREGEEALKALGLQQAPATDGAKAPPPAKNDAVEDLEAGRKQDEAEEAAQPPAEDGDPPPVAKP